MGDDNGAERVKPPSRSGAEAWEELRSKYKKEGIVLVLGAGVSKDSCLPNWEGLLENLLEELNDQAEQPTLALLRKHGMSLPMIASVIERRSSKEGRKAFVKKVREALYRKFPYRDGIMNREAAFVRDVREENRTLHAVCTICVVNGEPTATFVSNPRIGAVVTFNLDQLVQSYIRSRFSLKTPDETGRKLVRTVERASAGPHAQSDSEDGTFVPRRTNIYHLHGYLRFDYGAGNPDKESDKITLTEQDYFDVFNDPMSIFNYTFMHLLREWSCLFVGLSMQDENIRRLLHYSMKERMESLTAEDKDPAEEDEKLIRHFAILRSEGSDVDKPREESLRLLGTKVLWVEDYPEIADELKAMYEAAGDNWADVC